MAQVGQPSLAPHTFTGRYEYAMSPEELQHNVNMLHVLLSSFAEDQYVINEYQHKLRMCPGFSVPSATFQAVMNIVEPS